jgi:hypothetical protein
MRIVTFLLQEIKLLSQALFGTQEFIFNFSRASLACARALSVFLKFLRVFQFQLSFKTCGRPHWKAEYGAIRYTNSESLSRCSISSSRKRAPENLQQERGGKRGASVSSDPWQGRVTYTSKGTNASCSRTVNRGACPAKFTGAQWPNVRNSFALSLLARLAAWPCWLCLSHCNQPACNDAAGIDWFPARHALLAWIIGWASCCYNFLILFFTIYLFIYLFVCLLLRNYCRYVLLDLTAIFKHFAHLLWALWCLHLVCAI